VGVRILVIQHDDDAGLRVLEAPLAERGAQLEVWIPHQCAAPLEPFARYDGVVVLGGIVNPDEDAANAWLATERCCLEDALAEQIPTLGVCLGGQLLAQVAGGDAYRSPVPEVGWFSIAAQPGLRTDPVFRDFPESFDVFEWHLYRFDPPPGSQLLATTANATQAIRVGENAWGIQFHIEADAATVADWLSSGADEAVSLGVDIAEVLEQTTRLAPAQTALCHAMGRRFAEVVESRAAARYVAKPARTS
jgi:GMP synthase (glutamine-hydrolysing)